MSHIKTERERTRELLAAHYRRYPELKKEDVFKFLFQSAFGCEHLVSDESAALGYIEREYAQATECSPEIVEVLDGNYSRVHLSALSLGLKPKTLARLFCLSAKKEEDAKERLDEKLQAAAELINEGLIPLDAGEFARSSDSWRALGYPAVRHSDAFRSKYKPAYRVIANQYSDFLKVFTEIDKLSDKESCVVTIEGGSASGKSTLAEILKQVYDCNVFHIDDFFLMPHQRTEERLMQIGGNVDSERFYEEIIQPLTRQNAVTYRRFDCATQTLGDPITVEPKRLTVIEGVYSMHPDFGRYYDISVFLNIGAEYQKERILSRNSPFMAKRFFEEWIPLENAYFSATDTAGKCDISITISEKT